MRRSTDAHCSAVPYKMLGKFKDQCDSVNEAFGPATIAVTETNSRCKHRRPFWFHTVWSWLETRGFTSNASCFLTFWRNKAAESGAWLPGDKATIDVLNAIFEQSKALIAARARWRSAGAGLAPAPRLEEK